MGLDFNGIRVNTYVKGNPGELGNHRELGKAFILCWGNLKVCGHEECCICHRKIVLVTHL